MKNKDMLPYENMSKGRSRETTSIYYDNNSSKETNSASPMAVAASCIAFGIIAAPYVPAIYSVGFILGGGAVIALSFF